MWIAVLCVVLVCYVLYMLNENSYFPKNNIKCLWTYVPLMGNAELVVLNLEHFFDFNKRVYKYFKDEKYFGFKFFNKRFVLIKDIELIKQITIKDTDYFMDHMWKVGNDFDQLFSSNLMFLEGQQWRDMRATVSPTFTSSKMRGMFQLMTQCAGQMVVYFKNEVQKSNNKNKQYIELELKDTFSRYTIDAMASTIFGVNGVDSLKDRNNDFFIRLTESTKLRTIHLIIMILYGVMPSVMKFFKLKLTSEESNKFFKNLVATSIRDRETNGIERPDMIHLLMQAKKKALPSTGHANDKNEKDVGFATTTESDLGPAKDIDWSDDLIAAQVYMFYMAGQNASSDLIAFVLYEMARNPEMKKRLQEEIDEIAERNGGIVKYENLAEMKYLDMVVSETLRFWPTSASTDRKCVKPYRLPPSNSNSLEGGKLNVGDGVLIPIAGLHYDSRYYKDPEKFDPERFSDERKHEINPATFLPFGIGPRNCVGSRYAIIIAKAAIFNVLLHFDVFPTKKTVNSFEMSGIISLIPKSGIWIGMAPREGKKFNNYDI